jgi:hypothetical protein
MEEDIPKKRRYYLLWVVLSVESEEEGRKREAFRLILGRILQRMYLSINQFKPHRIYHRQVEKWGRHCRVHYLVREERF